MIQAIAQSMKKPAVLTSIVLAGLGPWGSVLGAGLTIELNKLETVEAACRAYLVFENKTEATYRSLKLDLVMFGQDGIILRRLAVEGGPLAESKTSVKLFEITGVTCEAIGRVLLNDVISCEDATGTRQDCLDTIVTRSRSPVTFFK